MTDNQLIIWLWAVAVISVFAIFSVRSLPKPGPEPLLAPTLELVRLKPLIIESARRVEFKCYSCHEHLK